jgi:acetyltransferase-like isoleucine patch superfamily enzyme
MLTPEARARRQAERQAFAAYLAGSHDAPFVLESHESYCACDVLFPSALAYARLGFRSAVMKIIGWMPLSALKVFFYRLLGVRIGRDVFIAPGVFIDPLFPWLIELEDGCLLGIGCRLFTHEYTATGFRVGRVRVGKGAVIGAYATVRSGVSIGDRVTVGFNSYVNRDVPDGETVGGVPAKPLAKKVEGR